MIVERITYWSIWKCRPGVCVIILSRLTKPPILTVLANESQRRLIVSDASL